MKGMLLPDASVSSNVDMVKIHGVNPSDLVRAAWLVLLGLALGPSAAWAQDAAAPHLVSAHLTADLPDGDAGGELGITYSESNALGSGLKEKRDGGLTAFGRKAVARMNKVGMLIDCSHAGDQTTLDTIETSRKPIVLTHIGARALWPSNRLAPDEVLKACADKGGVIGIEAAPHTTITPTWSP